MGYQKKHGYKSATATVTEGNVVKEAKLFDMDSTYLLAGRGFMFKAGDRYPWKARQGYPLDYARSAYGSLNDNMVSSERRHIQVLAKVSRRSSLDAFRGL